MTGRALIAAALFALLALPAAAQKPQDSVTVAHVVTLAHAPYYIALDKGYFVEEGLKVEESTVRSAQDVQSMLATGKLDVSMGAISTGFFNAQDQGLDLRVVAALGIQGEPQAYTQILVRKDLWDSGAIKSGKDLKTRKIGIIRNSLPEYLLVVMLEKYGMGVGDVEEVNLGFPEMSVALKNKGIDIAIIPDPFATTLKAQGDATLLLPESRTGIGDLSTMVFFSGEFMRQRPAVAVRFLRGLLRAARETQEAYNKNPDLARLLSAATKLSAEAIERSIPPGFDPTLDIGKYAASLRNQERVYMALGRLTYSSPLPMDRLIDTSFIHEAAASFVKK